ncbi:hypothetical protein WJX81_003975 [Elliptochloris bilobata]|uniref:anthranilate phosphoribosyltransferase n=1 Tax=Elliptochloris bilobata TaxID=381761 RepID=A0AAW1S5Y3_9CHLO
MKEILEALLEQRELTEQETTHAIEAMLDGAHAAQMAAFMVLLRVKGETGEEVANIARTLRGRSVPMDAGVDTLDIVGTGGDGIGSVNISTGASIIAAAAGARVAKHGSRSVSSLCGSADVLEALGVAVDLGPEGVAACLREVGLGFMSASRFNPAMAAVNPTRKALRVRTAFNLLGPLLNPARTPFSLVGVYSPGVAPLMADALRRLGSRRALVVHSAGLDELTPMAPADVVEVTQESQRSYCLDPRRLGIPSCQVADLAGGDAATNAAILRNAFGGARSAVADALNLNAGVALAAAEVAPSAEAGVALAQEVQRSGRAGGVLQRWIEVSQRCKAAETQ